MSEDQFTKLFTFVHDGFAGVDTRFDAADKRFDNPTTIIDGNAGKIDNYAREITAKAGVDLDKIPA